MRKFILLLGDIIALIISFFIIVFRVGDWHFVPHVFAIHSYPFLLLGATTILILYALDLYDLRNIKPIASNVWRLVVSLTGSFLMGVIYFYGLPIFQITPKTNLVIFFAAFGVLFILWRRAYFKIFSTTFKSKIVVWGDTTKLSQELIDEIKHNPHHGYEVLAVIHDENELLALLDQENLHLVVVGEKIALSESLVPVLFTKKVTVMKVRDMHEHIFNKISLETIDKASFVYNIQNHNKVIPFFYRVAECFIAGLIILVTSPLLIIIAIAIKLEDGGPVFYTHKRLGFLGKEFLLYKFRSMKTTATDGFHDRVTKKDSRVTKVGRIIRKLHVDEIPQMINVLKGDIGIVGPRPDMVSLYEGIKDQIPLFHLRLLVKPGFTGWAQIKFRNPEKTDDFEAKLEYDLYYIKHREPFMDLGIIVRTIQIIFSHF